MGYVLIPAQNHEFFKAPDMDNNFYDIYDFCKSYTYTGLDRSYALYKAIEYLTQNQVEGDFVECGVWRGGSSMIMAKTLLKQKAPTRQLYLYDTFTGMTEPTDKDCTYSRNRDVMLEWKEKKRDGYNEWCYASLEDVQNNMKTTGYPENQLHYVKGKVEETLPDKNLGKLALLRLDTDWYESTYHELCTLFPKLVSGGVLIIDDYGTWQGSREAVDQYFNENSTNILLNRIDQSGRIAIKN